MKIFKSDINIKSIFLISIEIKKDGYGFRFAKIKKGNSLDQIKYFPSDSIDELITVGKNLPVFIHVHGFGVLTRLTEGTPNFKDNLIVSGDKAEFYFSSYDDGDQILVSFIRKSLVQEFLSTLFANKLFIFEVLIGPIPLLQLKNKYKLINADYAISIQENRVTNFERNENQLTTRTNEFYLESYLNGFERDDQIIQALEDKEINDNKKEFKEFKRFINLGIGILVFFLVALVGNYFYVNQLNQRTADLETEINSFQENLAMIDRLEQEKVRKHTLIDNSGVQTDNYISFYLDEIGESVPEAIQFQTLEIFPLSEPLKPKKKVELNVNSILVKGICLNSKTLDDWIERIENKEWISSVEVINYVRISGNKSNFHILIKLGS